MLESVDWPVHTDRLNIRPATTEDLDATWQIRRLESVADGVSSAPSSRAAHAEEYLLPDSLAKRLVFELDGRVIGDLMVDVRDGWSQTEVADQAIHVEAELGWTLDPEHGGHGYASEAVAALIDLCFARLGLRRVVALCYADNVPSWQLMERLGMRREGHAVRESLHRTRGWLDSYTYALLADEWRATGRRDA